MNTYNASDFHNDKDSGQKVLSGMKSFFHSSLEIRFKSFFLMTVIFLFLPIAIFFMGYLRPLPGILFTTVLVTLVVFSVRDCRRDAEKALVMENDSLSVPMWFLFGTIFFAVAVTIVTGVGEFVWSTYDHAFRRAILRDLISYKWPIVYDPSTQSNPEVVKLLGITKPQGFVYYFTYWMPAALTGKLFGFNFANVFLVLWNAFGIFLTLIGMCFFCRRTTMAAWFTYLCFDGMTFIPNLVHGIIPYSTLRWLEGYVPHMEFVSNYSNICNVFNQVIPCYLIVVLIMLSRNNRNTGLLGGAMFAYSPWATIGMIPIALVGLFRKKVRAGSIRQSVLNLLSPGNLIFPTLALVVFGSFYESNSNAVEISGFTWKFYSNIGDYLLCYLVLIIIEIVPVALLALLGNRKNPFYWVSVGTLLVFPLYRISLQNDFLMRGTMPALFVLCILFCAAIPEYFKRKVLSRVVLFSCVAMSYVAVSMGVCVLAASFGSQKWPNDDIVSLGNISTTEYVYTIKDQFFVEEYEDSFFFTYLAK